MTDQRVRYADFKRVDAIQFTRSTYNSCYAFLPSCWNIDPKDGAFIYRDGSFVEINGDHYYREQRLKPRFGQWLVKNEDDVVIVQDEEPAWSEGWDWCAIDIKSDSPPSRYTRVHKEDYVRKNYPSSDYAIYRRPLIRMDPKKIFLWLGEWERVE